MSAPRLAERMQDATREELLAELERRDKKDRYGRRSMLARMAGNIAAGLGDGSIGRNPVSEARIAEKAVGLARAILARIDEVEP